MIPRRAAIGVWENVRECKFLKLQMRKKKKKCCKQKCVVNRVNCCWEKDFNWIGEFRENEGKKY